MFRVLLDSRVKCSNLLLLWCRYMFLCNIHERVHKGFKIWCPRLISVDFTFKECFVKQTVV